MSSVSDFLHAGRAQYLMEEDATEEHRTEDHNQCGNKIRGGGDDSWFPMCIPAITTVMLWSASAVAAVARPTSISCGRRLNI
jgi:hypothetical protein